jgi:alkanesulfonate monooxygenase SsuD/methylene tetrahydromethanopterin reductase-like flavin-dependent oxidoreductase (luciferase family)
MRLGMFMMPLHPIGRALHDVIDEDYTKALLLDELGFNELWVGEHFSAVSEPLPSPLMFMASLINQTKNLTFAPGVLNLPNRHPAVIAAELAQFDHMSKGRLIFGAGTGSLGSDFQLFKVPDEKIRQRMLIESLDMIQKIWSQDPPYNFKGEFWTIDIDKSVNRDIGFGFMPKPYQSPRPDIVIPAASANSSTIRLGAARGYLPLTSGLIDQSLVSNHWKMFQEGRLEYGKPAEGRDWRVVRSVFVAGSNAEARARLHDKRSSFAHFFHHMHTVLSGLGRLSALKSDPAMPDSDLTIESMIDARVIYGSPDTVAEKLAALRAQAGPFGTLLISGMDWSGPNAEWERESLTLLAKEVAPRLQAASREAERALA